MELSRMCWKNIVGEAMGDVAAHIDEGANLNFLGIWLETDDGPTCKVAVGFEAFDRSQKQLIAMLLLQLLRDGQFQAEDLLDVLSWVTRERVEDMKNESPETPATESE